MIFAWLKARKRKKIVEQEFSQNWRVILQEMVSHYNYLGEPDQDHLEKLIQIFIAEKNFEGCNGLEITDTIKVTIAAQACMLLLGLSHDLYKKLDSILVYPSTVVIPESRVSMFSQSPNITRNEVAILGQAFMRGPVILIWDAVKLGAKHPERGHNVVYHEFAHIIDMYDGKADGTPILSSKGQYKKWAKICTKEFFLLKERSQAGKKTFLDEYGATNEPEFFAVATEYFFDKPKKMKKKHPSLYTLLQNFYNQDPASRTKREQKSS